MSSTLPPPPPPEERRPRFQFSMATLMGVMTLVAVGMGVLYALPGWVGVLVVSGFQIAFTAFLIAGAFFGTGTGKTFCIGAIAAQFLTQGLPARLWMMNSGSYGFDSVGAFVFFAVSLVTALFGGLICVLSRRFWERRNNSQ